MFLITWCNRLRMLQWGLIAIALYAIAVVPAFWPPEIKTALQAAAGCTLGGWVGYWIDRTAFIKIDSWKGKPNAVIANRALGKAVIIAMCIIACNLKLG